MCELDECFTYLPGVLPGPSVLQILKRSLDCFWSLVEWFLSVFALPSFLLIFSIQVIFFKTQDHVVSWAMTLQGLHVAEFGSYPPVTHDTCPHS